MSTSEQDEVLYTLLCKYMLHEASAPERRQVEDWLQQDPQHPVLLARLEKLLAGVPRQAAFHASGTDEAWERLQAAMVQLEKDRLHPDIDAPGNHETKTFHENPYAHSEARINPATKHALDAVYEQKTRSFRPWMAVAAAVILLIAAGIWKLNQTPAMELAYTGPTTAMLDDGTTIKLDAGAQLTVQPGYNHPERNATLTGKAAFNVTPNAAHPFNLLLGSRLIQVLGTRFRISFTPENNALRIHVDTGTVMVKDSVHKDSVLLTSGMLLEAEGQAPAKVAGHITDADKKQLVFSDTPLKEVLTTLDVVYHTTVTADTSLLQLPVTATFTGETADNVLQSVAFITNTVIVRNGDAVTLVKQP